MVALWLHLLYNNVKLSKGGLYMLNIKGKHLSNKASPK